MLPTTTSHKIQRSEEDSVTMASGSSSTTPIHGKGPDASGEVRDMAPLPEAPEVPPDKKASNFLDSPEVSKVPEEIERRLEEQYEREKCEVKKLDEQDLEGIGKIGKLDLERSKKPEEPPRPKRRKRGWKEMKEALDLARARSKRLKGDVPSLQEQRGLEARDKTDPMDVEDSGPQGHQRDTKGKGKAVYSEEDDDPGSEYDR